MKKFVDTHCHIYKEYYDDVSEFMNKLENSECKFVINNAVDLFSVEEVLKYAEEYHNMYCAIGIHPEYANNYKDSDIIEIEKNINNKKVLAIGEIGLDYHYEGYNKEKQIELFNEQLSLAQEHNIPVIVHSRDATLDTINTLKKYKLKGIIHSFSGSYETAKEYIKMGYYLGINGVVTFKNAKLIDVINKIGINNIVLETDSPYLSPEPKRGSKNSPINIKYIIKFLSENLGISEDEIVDITNKNVAQIFDNP